MDQSNPPAVTPAPAPDAAQQALRRRRRSGLSVAALGVLLFVLLLFRVLGPKPVPPPRVVHYSPQQAADARKDFDSLRAQMLAPPSPVPAAAPKRHTSTKAAGAPAADISAPATAAPARQDTPVRMQLSQADLNTYLATDPHVKALLASRGVQAVQLLLQEPHNVTCRAAILYKGRRTNVQIVGSLRPSPDTVARFVATGAQVGALPLPPGVVTAQANRLAAQFTGRMRGRFPIKVQDIRVVGDHLILTGVRQSFAKR